MLHRLRQVLWDKKQLTLESLAPSFGAKPFHVLGGDDLASPTGGLGDPAAGGSSARAAPAAFPAEADNRADRLSQPGMHRAGRPAPTAVRVCVYGNGHFCPACGKGAMSLQRCINCGEWLLAAEFMQDRSQERYRPAKLGEQEVHVLTHRTEGLPGKPTFVTVGSDGSCGGDGESASESPKSIAVPIAATPRTSCGLSPLTPSLRRPSWPRRHWPSYPSSRRRATSTCPRGAAAC